MPITFLASRLQYVNERASDELMHIQGTHGAPTGTVTIAFCGDGPLISWFDDNGREFVWNEYYKTWEV